MALFSDLYKLTALYNILRNVQHYERSILKVTCTRKYFMHQLLNMNVHAESFDVTGH